jgi:hypothetical protein
MSRGKKWTDEEEEWLFNATPVIRGALTSNSVDWDSISNEIETIAGNKRSGHATKMKWKKLQETKVVETKPQLESWPSIWDEENDYFLLVNFYDMSIDEVREYFGRSYAECAGRLEQLIDSTELAHIELVKKAAMTVRERREPYVPKIPSSRKEKRLIAKMNKLNDKLMRLRGGEE